MYRNIIIALDGSESSQRALNEAIRMAKISGALVHAVFVADTAALSSFPVGYRSEVFRDARRMLDEGRARVRAAGLECETQLLETHTPDDSIAACLQRRVVQLQADLVVMGTHGRSGVRRLVLGSVAEAFVRDSTCPVLLIRSQAQT
ncbi:UspA domain-containing protein [Caballeronia temeraria]|uniref:UspA domain-containing protein n=1 Tax=Caballeronia temeraria TaxID=1777137 RepID=A0A158ARZ3_9BURK|nr:universal stress protein [Caballeronia temeraria]SAK60420.1 UspA domain-containing protein [Caballeronia temeraria]